MADGDGAPKADEGHYFGKVYDFQRVFREEIGIINARRALGETERPLQRQIALEREGEDLSGQPIERPKEDDNVVGLALSGGGIRSAAFCLGVLQALDRTKVLPKIDYLSTVSGGGYIGCSLTACLDKSIRNEGWDFPFASRLQEDEPRGLQHIRDYSNYLFPQRGALLRNATIYARGLIVNFILVAQVVLLGSAFTLLYYSFRGKSNFMGWPAYRLLNPFGLNYFFLTLDFGLLLIVIGLLWAVSDLLPLNAPVFG
jgi:patatin-like phospholipase